MPTDACAAAQVNRQICTAKNVISRYTQIGMPIRHCPETPDSKTKRCARHPLEPEASPEGDYADVCCQVCKSPDDAATMLLCGDVFGHGCDRGYHLACLTPPLVAVPAGAWFCPSCRISPKIGEDAARQDEVVRRRTRSQTREAQEQQATWEVERISDMYTDAQVSSDERGAGGPNVYLSERDFKQHTCNQQRTSESALTGRAHRALQVKRFCNSQGAVFYYIKWAGFPDAHSTWEPANCIVTPSLIEDFKRQRAARGESGSRLLQHFAPMMHNLQSIECFECPMTCPLPPRLPISWYTNASFAALPSLTCKLITQSPGE